MIDEKLIASLAGTKKYLGIRVLANFIFDMVVANRAEELCDCNDSDVFLVNSLAEVAEESQRLREKLVASGYTNCPDNDLELYQKIVLPMHKYLVAQGR